MRRDVAWLACLVAVVAVAMLASRPRPASVVDSAPPGVVASLSPMATSPSPSPRVVGPPIRQLVVNAVSDPLDIRGVRLGMSRDEVLRVAGYPHDDRKELATWRYRSSHISTLMNVTFDEGGAVYWVNGHAVRRGGRVLLRQGDPLDGLSEQFGPPVGSGDGFLIFRIGNEMLRVSHLAGRVTILTLGGRASFK
ncbi:MAG: hypothetical protein FJX76_05850 [Armatimonadetes bacterium]|nr:hypothetical protein [Armatimonadota bacterium]